MQRQKSFENGKASLFLVPTPIGNLSEFPQRAIDVLKNVDHIAAEDTRNTIKLLNHFDIKTPMVSHHEHNINVAIPKIIAFLEAGEDVAIVSDAGYPAISDPGAELVKAVIDAGYNAVPISGCNAALDALVVSGITPQPFVFYGFLAHDDKTKKKQLEANKNITMTTIYYEAPHRIKKTLTHMMNILGDRKIALCREITKKHEEILRGHISEILEVVDELKGEMVIVVEGATEVVEEVVFEQSIIEHVVEFVEKGMSKKDAIKEVAKIRGLGKNEVYNEYHK